MHAHYPFRKLAQEQKTTIFQSFLDALTFRTRPFEELPGEIDRIAQALEQEAPRFLVQDNRTFYAFMKRVIDTFATRSLVNDSSLPILGLLPPYSPQTTRETLQKTARKLQEQNVQLAVITPAELPFFNNQNVRRTYAPFAPIYQHLANIERFAPLAQTLAFWRTHPSPKDYFTHVGALQTATLEELSNLDLSALAVNTQLQERMAPHALTHAPNLCATHFSANQPIQLSAQQMAMIEEAKAEAKARKHAQASKDSN